MGDGFACDRAGAGDRLAFAELRAAGPVYLPQLPSFGVSPLKRAKRQKKSDQPIA